MLRLDTQLRLRLLGLVAVSFLVALTVLWKGETIRARRDVELLLRINYRDVSTGFSDRADYQLAMTAKDIAERLGTSGQLASQDIAALCEEEEVQEIYDVGADGIVAGGSGYTANEAAFVNLEFIQSFFPPWFMALFLVMILSGLLSSVDSNLCSVSSLASDFRGDLKTAKFSMLALLTCGILIANIPGITVTGLFLFYGTLRASTLFVTLLTIFGKRLAAGGVFYGVILSVLVGLPVFAFGSVADIPEMKVAGSVLSVGISGAFALLYTKGAGINEDYQSKR